jgi:predicted peptidase
MLREPRALALMVVASSLIGCAPTNLFVPDAADGFRREASIGGYVYLPKHWSADRAWPVIVYLHGGGETGDDGVRATQVGLGPVAWRSHGEFPFIVIFPQAPGGTYWGMPDNNQRVLRALDDVMTRYHGDPDRVYLTGNSLGGFGTWFMGALYADRFAALVPICGGVRGRAPKGAPFAAFDGEDRVREIARRIGKKPVWIFHGASDWLVPVGFSRELARVLKEQGGDARYTEYAGVGHDSWDRAYADPELWKWLAAQHR